MSWQERMEGELQRRKQELSRLARDKDGRLEDDALQKRGVIEEARPAFLGLLEELGVRKSLVGIKQDVWKGYGEVTAPDEIENSKSRVRLSGASSVFGFGYSLRYSYRNLGKVGTKTVTISVGETGSRGYSSEEDVHGEVTSSTVLSVGIIAGFPFERNRVAMAFVNSSVPGDILQKPLYFGATSERLRLVKAALDERLLEDCIYRTQNGCLPEDFKAKGEEALRKHNEPSGTYEHFSQRELNKRIREANRGRLGRFLFGRRNDE